MTPLSTILVAGLVVLSAGCIGEMSGTMPRCSNEHPRGTDCSYAVLGLRASANYDEPFNATSALHALEEVGWPGNMTREGRAVESRNGSHEVRLRADDHGSWFEWSYSTPFVEGLTLDETAAEGERRCAAGPGQEMERLLASIEAALGWSRLGGGICSAVVAVGH